MSLATCRFQDGTVKLLQLQQPFRRFGFGGIIVTPRTFMVRVVTRPQCLEHRGSATYPVFLLAHHIKRFFSLNILFTRAGFTFAMLAMFSTFQPSLCREIIWFSIVLFIL